MKIVLTSLRVFFIILLITTAIGKLLDIQGFALVIDTYQFHIPYIALAPLALAVALFELFLGLALFARYRLRECAILIILMHVGYTVLATTSNLRGLELDNCGCFGVFLARPLTWFTVLEDLTLTALSVLFYWGAIKSATTSA